jgi:O-antigen/teichoic acid export membrane protein
MRKSSRTPDLKKVLRIVFVQSSISLQIRVFGILSSIAISIILARLLGAELLGAINLINTFVTVAVTISLLGINNVLIREISINSGDKESLKSIIYSCVGITLISSTIITVISMFVLTIYSDWKLSYIESVRHVAILMTLSIPLITISRLMSSILNGLNRIWQSKVFEDSLSFFIIITLLVVTIIIKGEIRIIDVASIYLISRAVTLFLSLNYVGKLTFFPHPYTNKLALLKKYFNQTISFIPVSIGSILYSTSDIILLGLIAGTREVALYVIAVKLSSIIMIILQVTNSSIAPRIASLYPEGKIKDINTLTHQVTRVISIVSSFYALIFIFFGNSILSLWGSEFVNSYSLVIILLCGQLINSYTSCAGTVLNMCGGQKTHSKITLIMVFAHISLNILLIPYFGAKGAAIATASILVVENTLKAIYSFKIFGINTTPIKINEKF